MHCTRCGHNNPEGSRFCAQCGAALSQERVGESTSIIPKVGGEDSGEQVEVSADTKVQLMSQANEWGQVSWDGSKAEVADQYVGQMLQLIVATREFQFA